MYIERNKNMPRKTKTINGIRKCSDCYRFKPVTEYRSMGGKRSHLLSSICKDCQSARDKERRSTKEYRDRENALRRTENAREKNRQYLREYYKKLTPEQKKQRYENSKKYSKSERAKQRRAENRRLLRLEFIERFGGKCTCCGEDTFEFLTVEHIHGGGGQQRKKVSTEHLLRKLRREGWKDTGEYTVLCFNCNQAKGAYGFCPHNK